MKVVIIGSGNVATVLGKKIAAAGHDILQVASRSIENSQTLAAALNTSATADLRKLDPNADLYMLCVADKAISAVADNISYLKKTVVHTAGAMSKNILESFASYGVVYPLQSLRKEITHLPEIPVLIDGNDEQTISSLQSFATSWASQVDTADDAKRLRLHLAAVFASNFTNHLYALTEDFCKNESIDFKQLLPLIRETAGRLELSPAAKLQTGPAIRNDVPTMQIHEEILSRQPELKNLYLQLSQSIINYHQHPEASI